MDKRMLDLFIYWINERHTIFLKKEVLGKPHPWTDDPILLEYKFTNPFRYNDKVTRELNKRLKNSDNKKTLFKKIIIFRMFNWPYTYDLLDKAGLVQNWDVRKAIKLLTKYKEDGYKLFTGAYMQTAVGAEGKGSRTAMTCRMIDDYIKDTDKILAQINKDKSMEAATYLLMRYKNIGGFLAYEFVCDMRFTSILHRAVDKYTWAHAGPGAKRGIHRLLFDLPRGQKPAGIKVDYNNEMRNLLVQVKNKLGKHVIFKDVTFEMRDIEHSLCEFDKYMRIRYKESTVRSRYVYNKS